MLVELHQKGGNLCSQAKAGEIHCPLIVRPTSEDVVTGQIIQTLKLIDPRHWVAEFLNTALRTNRFPRQIYRSFRIESWKKKPAFPRELLKWDEGSTEVDVQLTWENPPTTIYIEAKYGSKLSPTTANNDGTHGFPADQLIRNIRVGLHENGYYQEQRLFDAGKRDFAVIVLAPDQGQPLVEKYRDESTVKSAIPHSDKITNFPTAPFVGDIGYSQISQILSARRRYLTPAERRATDELVAYLTYKRDTRPNRPTSSK